MPECSVQVYLTRAEREMIGRAARLDGRSISNWLLNIAYKHLGQQRDENEPKDSTS